MHPTGMFCAIPSRVAVGEPFFLKLRLLGEARVVAPNCWWSQPRPALATPFNLNTSRQIRFLDNCLPEWTGNLHVSGDGLAGPDTITFDGTNQGVYVGDHRPVGTFGPFHWTTPGFHFLRISEPGSGVECRANAAYATAGPPAWRVYWGDPHWQTYFSDGIRAPEELYQFARDEGFLDFGAISDHVEAITDRQWEYFVAVTNDYNEPGRFATLVGQEWTNHEPGHRNIYYRGDHGPVLRSTDPRYDTLPKLWQALDSVADLQPLAIPHHSANQTMGVDWELGWNPRYEKAVEVYSVWGSSERHENAGNTRPIRALGGEVRGQHVIDALARGYRLGFVGGGDVHDGRPGEALHAESYPPMTHVPWPQGLTACLAPELTREGVFDAIAEQRTYATTNSRTYLDANWRRDGDRLVLSLAAASHQGIDEAIIVHNGHSAAALDPSSDDGLALEAQWRSPPLAPDDYLYVRICTTKDEWAWSSPVWGSDG
ncbi:MAG: DUF3604 domain-containing protein [Victivallales bacterium]|jgi:hypothetical protein|nr:DUF3604 domain-containing protein [Victivallales bacterium]MBT7300559.1 DUF3604 domain-containing protein [Victivallales bacterium]